MVVHPRCCRIASPPQPSRERHGLYKVERSATTNGNSARWNGSQCRRLEEGGGMKSMETREGKAQDTEGKLEAVQDVSLGGGAPVHVLCQVRPLPSISVLLIAQGSGELLLLEHCRVCCHSEDIRHG